MQCNILFANPLILPVRLTFILGEPWNDNWAKRDNIEFKENAVDVEAAVQKLYDDAFVDQSKDIKITARVVNFQ